MKNQLPAIGVFTHFSCNFFFFSIVIIVLITLKITGLKKMLNLHSIRAIVAQGKLFNLYGNFSCGFLKK